MKKRGEISSSTLIGIILIIVGFIVVASTAFGAFSKEDLNREICHDSVLLRGLVPDTLGLKNLPSLKCQTRKICLTDRTFGKGDCSWEFKKEKYETVRVNSKDEINKFFARELADCWSMMGKGEIQIFTRGTSDKKNCAVCSRVAFDEELKQDIGEVEGLDNYLLTREVPNQNESYWKYLTKNKKIPDDRNFGLLTTDEKAVVFIELGEDVFLRTTSELLGLAVGGVLGFKTGSTLGGATAGYLTGTLVGKWVDKEVKYRTGWFLVDYNSEELKKLECTSFENIP